MMDAIIDKLTQLGVDRIIPMETSNVVVRLDAAKKATRLSRWRKISRSASKQSKRRCLPAIEPVSGLSSVLAAGVNYDLKLIPTLAGERRLLKDVVNSSNAGNILVLIGPEGDFTPEEVRLACGKGAVPVSLGDSVLRVDTAAIAITSYLKLTL
jgi:16S rRNA (uracil1498-N3)-methyltransferase